MRKTLLLISSLVLVMTGCASLSGSRIEPAEKSEETAAGIPDYSKAKGSIRLMTYNVGVFGKYIDNSVPLVADLIKEAKPDIVGLNELDSCNRRHSAYQLEELNSCLGKGWNFVFQSMFPYQEGGYGIGVETTHKILSTKSYDIPKTPGVKHMGLLAVETNDFVFMSTHLNVTGSISLEQAKLINEYVRKDYWSKGKPVFLAGDMNSRPGSATIAELERYWTVISAKEPTFPSTAPDRCIDYVLILNNIPKYTVVKSSACTGFKSGDVKVASDHIPIFVDVILP
ncbi:MAG: endonuclease/exonuclease/phosphatase family protein [Bacteroidales bacterium]|nr:endonuclease/exonuclease/phosphatase family protein [Bacteroidales bacterium]